MATDKIDHVQIIKKLKKLEEYKNSKFPILSIYLGTSDEKSPSSDFLLSQFHSEVVEKMKEKEKTLFKNDIGKIETYLKDLFNTRGNSSIVFFTAGENLFEILYFEFTLPNLYTISKSPFVTPVLKEVRLHQKYLVLLVDREKAQLFTVHLGEIEEKKYIFDPSVPQKVKHGDDTWDAQDKIFRHIEDHLNRHLKLIAEETAKFIQGKNIHFIILGSHKGLFTKIKKHLPQALAKKIRGTFVTGLNIPLNDVFLKSKKIAAEI